MAKYSSTEEFISPSVICLLFLAMKKSKSLADLRRRIESERIPNHWNKSNSITHRSSILKWKWIFCFHFYPCLRWWLGKILFIPSKSIQKPPDCKKLAFTPLFNFSFPITIHHLINLSFEQLIQLYNQFPFKLIDFCFRTVSLRWVDEVQIDGWVYFF